MKKKMTTTLSGIVMLVIFRVSQVVVSWLAANEDQKNL